MPTLHVILERGLGGREACLELDGREIFSAHALPSDMMKGFSAQVDVPLDEAAPSTPAPTPEARGSRLVVRLPAEGLEVDILLPPSEGDLWVAVSLTPGGLVSDVGHEPRGYL